MMLKKIISGGQTGADRAALDAAITAGIPHGGWIPKGRLTEEGVLPDHYQLAEMPTESYAERTEKNVSEANGTLIISFGALTGGSEYTKDMALKHGRQFLHIDLMQQSPSDAASLIQSWLEMQRIGILNVAGPRASKDARIYPAVLGIMRKALAK